MTSSAYATCFATQEPNHFAYVFLIQNTSSGQFDIYCIQIGAPYDVSLAPGGLQNIVPVSAPSGWQLVPSAPLYGFLFGWTNYAGSPAASGYIMPGDVGVFTFTSTTPPPKTLVFGCCFYNDNNEWGFAYNGIAEQVQCVPIPIIQPLLARRPPVRENPAPRIPQRGTRMLGTTTRTIGGDDGAPTVHITYDRWGNIVAMSPGPPKLELRPDRMANG
jgi:hypothetical protein